MKKKLLILTTYYMPNVSGITIYIKVLAEELIKRGYSVTILTSKHQNNLADSEVINGVLIKRLWAPIKIGKGLIMPWFPFVLIKEMAGTDIINCHLPSLESVFAILGNLFFRKKLITTYHCEFDSGNKIVNKLISWTHGLVLNFSSHIIVNTKDYIEGYGLLKNYQEKITEIYPPTIVKKSDSTEKVIINKKFNKYRGKKIIGFLGRISKEKNLEILFNTITNLLKNNVDFIIAMAGPKKVIGESEYQKKIKKLLDKNKNVILRIGEIKNVSNFINRCDCLVIPSNNKLESFGIVQIEAIKNGVPCVSSNLPGIRTVVQKTKMGELFEPLDTEDFSNKIAEVLLKGKEFYKKRAKNLELFNYQKSIDKYETILGDN